MCWCCLSRKSQNLCHAIYLCVEILICMFISQSLSTCHIFSVHDKFLLVVIVLNSTARSSRFSVERFVSLFLRRRSIISFFEPLMMISIHLASSQLIADLNQIFILTVHLKVPLYKIFNVFNVWDSTHTSKRKSRWIWLVLRWRENLSDIGIFLWRAVLRNFSVAVNLLFFLVYACLCRILLSLVEIPSIINTDVISLFWRQSWLIIR